MKKLIVLLVIIISFSSIKAQLVIDSEFRSTFQALHGWKKPVLANTDALFSVNQRSRIIFNYNSDKIKTRFSIQDTRVWGSGDVYNSTGLVTNTNSLGIHEAWAEIVTGKFSSLRVGRQEWNYNDMRVLCWRNAWTTGLSYDAILYKIHNENKSLLIDIGASYNADGPENGFISTNSYPDRLKTVNFLNIEKKFNKNTSLAVMFAFTGKQDTSMTNDPLLMKGTHGLYFKMNQGKKANDGLMAKFSAYYQHGTDMSRVADGSSYKKVSAYLFDVQLGFRTMNKKLDFYVGSEYISGKDSKNTEAGYNDIQHNFDLLYSGRFPYYGGYINQFISGGSSTFGTKSGGLLDPYLAINFSPAKGKTIMFKVWQPMLATNVAYTDNTGNTAYYDKSLGTNFDLVYIHKFSKSVIFKVIASYAMLSDTKNHMVFGYADPVAGTLKELGHNYSVFTMLIIKPNFFKGEVKKKENL